MKAFSRMLSHDWPVLALVLLNLMGIGFYLGVGPAREEGEGYRVIDATAVRRLLDSGELSGREARWYHPARPGESAPID